MIVGQSSVATTDSPLKAQDSLSLGHPNVALFSPGLMHLTMKQMHHSLSEITVPVSAATE